MTPFAIASLYTYIFFNFPLYLQSVPIHSANVVKSFTKACGRVLSSAPLQLIGSDTVICTIQYVVCFPLPLLCGMFYLSNIVEWICIYYLICLFFYGDRLCGPEVTVCGYRFKGPGSIPGVSTFFQK
jgi:hypothetical protein